MKFTFDYYCEQVRVATHTNPFKFGKGHKIPFRLKKAPNGELQEGEGAYSLDPSEFLKEPGTRITVTNNTLNEEFYFYVPVEFEEWWAQEELKSSRRAEALNDCVGASPGAIRAMKKNLSQALREKLDNSEVKSDVEKAVEAKHYNDYHPGWQWIDSVSRIPRYKDPEVFKGALELQVRKYLDRNGGKDSEVQELQKALWYLNYLVLYVKNDNKPITASEHKILGK